LARLNKYIDGVRNDGAYTHQGRAAVAALREIARMVGGDTVWLFGCSDPETSTARPVVDLVRERIADADGSMRSAAEKIVTAMYLYSGDTLTQRGPRGCMWDALKTLAPDVHATVEANGWDAAHAEHVGEDSETFFAEFNLATREMGPLVTIPTSEPREGGARQMEEERIYPCAKCPSMRTKAEGGTVFTVCDACWDDKPEADIGPGEPFHRANFPGLVLSDIRTALGCQPGHELEAIAALVAAKDAYRDMLDSLRLDFANACDVGRRLYVRLSAVLDERDAAIARTDAVEKKLRRVLERLEVMHACPGDEVHAMGLDVLAILQGSES
jgi:hypothetical protein